MIFILKSHEMTGLKNSKKNVTLKKIVLLCIPPSLSTQKIQCKQSNYYLKTWKQLFCVALLHDMYYTINYLNSHDILLQTSQF